MKNYVPDPVFHEHQFRWEAGRIVSRLARVLGSRHLQLAEDAVQEAMLRAVQLWPFQGVPSTPEAWLFRVAHNYAISALRRNRIYEAESEDLISRLQSDMSQDGENQPVPDDELRMIFMCCHPDLPENARVALSLKLIAGFSVSEIARLFFAPEPTIAQRLVRAKTLFRERALPLELPPRGDLVTDLRVRQASVQDTIYLMFSAGYTAHSGAELIGRDACFEAMRLGRLLSGSGLSNPRSDALLALMCLQAARFPARTNTGGELVLLEEQDHRLWIPELIHEGLFHFDRSITGQEISTWHVEAAIAALYANAPSSGAIHWAAILNEYDLLVTLTNSPVVLMNRAVVVGRVHGPAAGLAALEPLEEQRFFHDYYLAHAIRGNLLMELDRHTEAESAFTRALECTCSEPEKQFVRARLLASQLS